MTIINAEIRIRRNTAALMPAVLDSGELFFQTDTNKLYCGTGTGVAQVGGAATTWGTITGTLANQTDLQAALTALTTAINSEATTRAAADTTNATAITTEASTRSSADTTLQSNITSEASTRASADTTLQSNITSEASTRASADTTEATTRATADTTNATAISTETTRATAAEATKEATANKDAASGYAGLDSSTLLKLAEFPPHLHALLPYMPNLAIDQLFQVGLASAFTYTVPANKRAFLALWVLNASDTASETVQLQVKFLGTGLQYTIAASLAITNTTAPQPMHGTADLQPANSIPLFEATDVITITGATAVVVYGQVFTFDSSSGLKCPRLLALNQGLNTIYTVPAGKKAFHNPLNNPSSIPALITSSKLNSGIVRKFYKVPSGTTTPQTKHNVFHASNATLDSVASQPAPVASSLGHLATLDTGDSLKVEAFPPTGKLTLTSVANASGGSTVYTGTITGGGSNALAGAKFSIRGFATDANNGDFDVSASTTTTITVNNASGVAETKGAQALGFKFPLSAAANNSAGVTTAYTGVFPIGGTTAAGWKVLIAGFSNAVNNGTFLVISSTTTTITVDNGAGIAETITGSVTFTRLNDSVTTIAHWLNYILEF